MTTYLVATNGGTTATLTLVPSSTWQLRVVAIEVSLLAGSGGGAGYTLYHYLGASVSGGTAKTPLPLRAGAQAALATAKLGATITGGTFNAVHSEQTNLPATTSGSYAALNSSYKFPVDLIMTTGSLLWLSASANVGIYALDIYFEELHLARTT